MALPKIDLPIYEIKLPSNGQVVKIRPFLVKEEKLLLMAVESNDTNEIINVTKQVINNCILEGNINVETLPFFDIDYLFIALRAKSVGEAIEVKFTCNNEVNGNMCGTVFPAQIDIGNSEIVKDDTIKKLNDVGKNIKMKMRYPNYTTMKMILENDTVLNKQLHIIVGSVDQIIDGDKIHTTKDFTKQELLEFLEGLTKENYNRIVEFIENLPSFVVKANATCNKCGYNHNLTYSEFSSFFV
jgi:hypothetical protein